MSNEWCVEVLYLVDVDNQIWPCYPNIHIFFKILFSNSESAKHELSSRHGVSADECVGVNNNITRLAALPSPNIEHMNILNLGWILAAD